MEATESFVSSRLGAKNRKGTQSPREKKCNDQRLGTASNPKNISRQRNSVSFPADDSQAKPQKGLFNPFHFKYNYTSSYFKRFSLSNFEAVPSDHKMDWSPITPATLRNIPRDQKKHKIPDQPLLFNPPNQMGEGNERKHKGNEATPLDTRASSLESSNYLQVQLRHLQSQALSMADSAAILPVNQYQNENFHQCSRSQDSFLMSHDGDFTNTQDMLNSVTTDLVALYRFCDPFYQYDEAKNPKRALTKPSKGLYNNGFDNENYDYILYVNGVFGNEESRKFLVLDVLGHGTFGQVAKCVNLKTKEIVAIKIIKNQTAYFNQSMMEVTILELLNQKYDLQDLCHITRMKDTFIYRKHLCIVFELLSINLFELIRQNQFRGFSHSLVRNFLIQILDALKLLNEAKIIHGDLKPENILLKRMDSPEIKVIDFGSACHEHHTVYTYIQSRFYRSPEILFGLPYHSSIDMWSLGCISAELFLGLPIFPGHSNYDQVFKIVQCLGMPPNHMIEKGKTTNLYFERVNLKETEAYEFLQDPSQLDSRMDLEASSASEHIYIGSGGRGGRSQKKTYQYRLRPRDKNEKPSKQYFAQSLLEDIIMEYNGIHPTLTQRSSKDGSGLPAPLIIDDGEKRQRECFLDFLRGLLKYHPLERWTPQQARKHPYITGEPWIGSPFQPPGTTFPSISNTAGVKKAPPAVIMNGMETAPPPMTSQKRNDINVIPIEQGPWNGPSMNLNTAGPSMEPTIGTYSSMATNPRQRAFTLNASLFSLPPQIQRLAQTITYPPPPLLLDLPSMLLPPYSLMASYPNIRYPRRDPNGNVLMMDQPINHDNGGGFVPWRAPPGGASQNILDFRREYLFSSNSSINYDYHQSSNEQIVRKDSIGLKLSDISDNKQEIVSKTISSSMPQLHGKNPVIFNRRSESGPQGISNNNGLGSHDASFMRRRKSSHTHIPQLPSVQDEDETMSIEREQEENMYIQGSLFSSCMSPSNMYAPNMDPLPIFSMSNQNLDQSNSMMSPTLPATHNTASFPLPYQDMFQSSSSYNPCWYPRQYAMNNYITGGGHSLLTHSLQQRRISNPPSFPYYQSSTQYPQFLQYPTMAPKGHTEITKQNNNNRVTYVDDIQGNLNVDVTNHQVTAPSSSSSSSSASSSWSQTKNSTHKTHRDVTFASYSKESKDHHK